MSILVIAEHDNATLKPATLHAVTAAAAIGGDVHVLVAGSGCSAAADAAAKIAGVTKALVADSAELEHQLAENLAPLVVEQAKDYGHVLAPATSNGKNLMPRVAALLDVQQISDIIGVESPDTFVRPIYAGNAISTVQSADPVKVITVRTTAFDAAAEDGGSGATEAVSGSADAGLSRFVGEELSDVEIDSLREADELLRGAEPLPEVPEELSVAIRGIPHTEEQTGDRRSQRRSMLQRRPALLAAAVWLMIATRMSIGVSSFIGVNARIRLSTASMNPERSATPTPRSATSTTPSGLK